VRAAVGVVYGTAALLAGIGVVLGQASSSVHIAGIVVLAIAGIVALAMLALVPVYGDSLDERMSAGLLGRAVRGGRAWTSSAGLPDAPARDLQAGLERRGEAAPDSSA
jgi:hypothetical protein